MPYVLVWALPGPTRQNLLLPHKKDFSNTTNCAKFKGGLVLLRQYRHEKQLQKQILDVHRNCNSEYFHWSLPTRSSHWEANIGFPIIYDYEEVTYDLQKEILDNKLLSVEKHELDITGHFLQHKVS